MDPPASLTEGGLLENDDLDPMDDLGPPAIDSGLFWTQVLSGRSSMAIGNSDRGRYESLVTQLDQNRDFIDTDVLSNASPPNGALSLSSPGPPSRGILSPLPGELPFRFGGKLHSTFSFPQAAVLTSDDQTQGIDPSLIAAPSNVPLAHPSPSSARGLLSPPSLSEGFMTTPVPSRPSSPDSDSDDIQGPVLGLTTDILKLSHAVRHRTSNYPPPSNASPTVSASPSWSPGLPHPIQTTDGDNTLAAFFAKHLTCLVRSIDNALLMSVAATYGDCVATSEFILFHPPARLQPSVDLLYTQVWWTLARDPNYRMQTKSLQEIRGKSPLLTHILLTDDRLTADVMSRVNVKVFNSKLLRRNHRLGKTQIGDYLKELFAFGFTILLGKKDGDLFRLKQQPSSKAALELLHQAVSSLAYAHRAVYVKLEPHAPPVTVHSHPEVADFDMETLSNFTRASRGMHHLKAYERLVESRALAERNGRPWNPTPTQQLILDKPPQSRYGPEEPQLLRIVMPGGLYEVYFLNFQSGFLLFIVRRSFELLHHKPLGDGETESVVLRYFNQQRRIHPWSTNDTVWRLLILPMAMCAAALYVVQENIDEYMASTMDPNKAMNATPNVALVFQAKLLAVEKVISDWRSNPVSVHEYPLLRHRLLEIMADVVRPGDDYIGYDLIGPVFTAGDADHLAYHQSLTTREHTLSRRVQPLRTRAPTILESSYLSSSRSRASVLSLLGETTIT